MWTDTIVDEVRKYREEHASRFNYDLDKIYQDLKDKEKKNPNIKISLKPKVFLKPTGTI